MEEWRNVRTMSRAEMLKRVARFKELKGSDKGLPDSHLPESHKTLYAVIGFEPPEKVNEATYSPVGDYASSMPAIPISEGFNLAYVRAKPGKGTLMHNHDTNETFVAMTGRWRAEWNEGSAKEYVDLEPLDVITFPVGVARRFFNVTWDQPDQEHILMAIIGGNQPQSEFTPEAMQRCKEWDEEQAAARR
jgi:mannose-6-phosphate isomerase-like protein (cupin superfamily)